MVAQEDTATRTETAVCGDSVGVGGGGTSEENWARRAGKIPHASAPALSTCVR